MSERILQADNGGDWCRLIVDGETKYMGHIDDSLIDVLLDLSGVDWVEGKFSRPDRTVPYVFTQPGGEP